MITHLCFHGIGTCEREREPGEARYWISEDLFLRVLDEVTGREDVELSFDDGNVSDVETAFPALQERALEATFFALAGRLEDPASLQASDLRQLRDAGLGIGSHGWHHVPWRGLSETDRRTELEDARTALEEAAGTSVRSAALPLGRYDRETLKRLKTAGYQRVYTSDRFPALPGAWLQARYSLTAEDTIESVRGVLARGPRVHEARQALASVVKRLR